MRRRPTQVHQGRGHDGDEREPHADRAKAIGLVLLADAEGMDEAAHEQCGAEAVDEGGRLSLKLGEGDEDEG